MRWVLPLLLLLAASCGGARPCAAETTACGCYARSAECTLVTEACWCPSECESEISCVCGGGKFLRCEPRAP